MIKTFTINAGQRVEFGEEADFFRLMQSSDPVNVEFFSNEKRIVEAENVNEGYAEKFETSKFQRIAITSSTTQEIQFVLRNGNVVEYDQPPTGSVTVENVNGQFTSTQKTVTNASGTLVDANANRRYLLIQNNDGSGSLSVNLQGSVATTANSVLILPGGSYECSGFVPYNKITAIGSIPSNSKVLVVEG